MSESAGERKNLMKIIDAALIAKVKFVALFAVSYLDRKGTVRQWNLVSRGEQPKCVAGALQG